MNTEDVLLDCGGRPTMTGGERIWDFGSRPSNPEDTAAVAVPFDPNEDVPEITGDRVALWNYARGANGGAMPPLNWQLTGSCVNGGFQNALIVRIAIECSLLPDAETFKAPFTLAAYGLSRQMMGWNTPGEGSSGDAIARAFAELGVTGVDDPDAPRPTAYQNAFCYTKDVELRFSAFRNCPPGIRERSKNHQGSYTVVTTLDAAEKELRRGRPLTVAGNWGGRTMGCQYRGSGPNRILWNGDREDTWQHQQSILGVWHHPEFGRLWYWQNQWFYLKNGDAEPIHGRSANDEPQGGYWTDDRALQHQLSYRFGEVRALKGFKGFTDGKLNFGNI